MSSTNLIMLALNGLLGLAIPILLALWLIKKYHCRIQTILIGAGVFFLFALVLESLVHTVVLKAFPIRENIWAMAIYGGLMAGLFEESGRFLAMKFLLKKDDNHTALAYGAGHGGMEMIMLFGVTMLTYFFIGLMVNMGKADLLTVGAPAEAKDQIDALIASIQSNTPGSYLCGLWERLSALVLQISLSVIVFMSVRSKGRWWLYPVAIGLHALVDGVAVLMMGKASMVMIEVVVMCMALAYAGIAYMIAKRNA